MNYWAVLCIEKEHQVKMAVSEQKLDLTWADGMIGVMPIFKDENSAKKYAGKKLHIFEIQETEKK